MNNGNEVNKLDKKQALNLIWKAILKDYEQEVVELTFPELTTKIEWGLGVENLEEDFLKIQDEMYGATDNMKLVDDRLIKVRLKDNRSIILFIHIEVENGNDERHELSTRMFRYFGRIKEKFRYEYNDDSIILTAAIYSNKATSSSKNIRYNDNETLTYSFRTINIDNINDESPLKLLFKGLNSFF